MTRRQFFDRLPDPIKARAYHNSTKLTDWYITVTDAHNAIAGAFDVAVTPEGSEYWFSLIKCYDETENSTTGMLAMLMYDFYQVNMFGPELNQTASKVFPDTANAREIVTWTDLALLAQSFLDNRK